MAGPTLIFLETKSPMTGKDSAKSFTTTLSFSEPPVSVKSLINLSKTPVSISSPLIVFNFSSSVKYDLKLPVDFSTALPSLSYPTAKPKLLSAN